MLVQTYSHFRGGERILIIIHRNTYNVMQVVHPCLLPSVARCPPLQLPGSLRNAPVVTPSNTSVEYLEKAFLNCTVPGRGSFSRERQCVFDITVQEYALVGDQLDCGGELYSIFRI